MKRKIKILVLFTLGIFCLSPELAATEKKKNETEKKETLKKTKQIWEDFSKKKGSLKPHTSVKAGVDDETRQMVQNGLITLTKGLKEAKKLREEIKALRKETPKKMLSILSTGARKGTGGIAFTIGAIFFCLSINKKTEERGNLPIFGSIGVVALGALLLLL